MSTNQIIDASSVIDGMGGTSVVAEMCDITTGAVSQWRTSENGIPKPWIAFFKERRPDLFPACESKEAA